MSNPSIPPLSSRHPVKNGHHNSSNDEKSSPPSGGRGPSLLASFLGGFAAIAILGLVAGGIYLGVTSFHSSSGSGSSSTAATTANSAPAAAPSSSVTNALAKGTLQDAATWQEGPVNEAVLSQPEKPDISWWTRTFYLPNLVPQITDFLKKQGLVVNEITPIHYADNKDATTITYEVNFQVPGELLRVPMATWMPTNPDDSRFARILVLNKGLPRGIYWDTAQATVANNANMQKLALLRVHLNKLENTVTADRLISRDLVTPQEVTEYQNETQQIIANLNQRIQQIDAQVQQDVQTRLAQVPADPPKPKPQTAHFGGDGSGEPTKSAERIGGGAAAGAAGGALFGAIAGNAGMGAGIGAGVGLLGGVIYNAVSKDNDKKKLEREVADQNAERLDNWKAQCRALNKQREQIKASAPQERDEALNALANQIAANQGYLEPNGAGSSPTPPPDNAPQPTSQQGTGPVHQP